MTPLSEFGQKSGTRYKNEQMNLIYQCIMAERVGFEPTVRLPVQRFSRPLRANGRPAEGKIEVQISLAACPRNHLYRTGHRVIERGSFCFVFNAEFDHFRDLAYDLHLQSIFRRANRNSLDQATEDL